MFEPTTLPECLRRAAVADLFDTLATLGQARHAAEGAYAA